MTCARSLLALVLLLACLLPSLDGRDAPYVKRVRSQRSLLSQLQGHEGTDRAGSDLLEQPALLRKGATAKHCAQLCLDTEGCKAWSYDPSGGAFTCSSPHPAPTSTPHCYLKHSHATVAAHPCRTSGTPYATLATPAFPKLPASAVQPTGWLATQLRLQQSGLAGHLQLFWADVSDSSFIGGQHDTPEHNHERFLYWLNGALPMAYFNNDTQLITQVANFTNYLITHQRADGWIGPSENYDPWPRMLALYIFSQYSEFNSSDARVVPAMYSYLRFLWKQYSDPKYNPMDYMWTYVRIEDMQTNIEWLYDNHPLDQAQFLLDLNAMLYNMSWDWKDYYHNKLPTGDIGHAWNYVDHGVNNGMAIKSAAVQWRQSQDPTDVESCYERMEKMDRYHGQASGIFSCDECLAGLNPSRGTELCTVVETMFSYSTIFSILGDPIFADKVEQITFNALPASITPDMWAHQYLQQSNQAYAKQQADPWWNTDGGDSVLFGLEPNYGCCTANFPQGYPKYLTASWLLVQNDKSTGLLAAFLGPSNVAVVVEDPTYGNNSIRVEQITMYPLKADADVQFVITADHPFPLSIRIPGWAAGATLANENGNSTVVANGTIHVYEYSAKTSVTITLHLPYTFRTVRRFNDAVSVYYGPLLMALDFSFNTTVLHRYAFNSTDMEYLPIDAWNYALLLDDSNPARSFNVSTADIPAMPWDPLHPTITATAYAREIDWPTKHDSADEPPHSPINSNNPLVPVTLIPYGATLLRIAEIPTLVK